VKTLLVGCGNAHNKRMWFNDTVGKGSPDKNFDNHDLVLHDFSPIIESDYSNDLNYLPYPWADEEFDEVHAYSVLEHSGTQGDGYFFFEQFNEFWRVLKPNGYLMLSVPIWDNEVAWGVPDHKRVFPGCVFSFLTEEYYKNVGKPDFADYRHMIKGFWDIICNKKEPTSGLLYVVMRKA
jgi:SAM-dependent methyltransferase